MTYIELLRRENGSDTLRCARCGRPARAGHHQHRRCEGGTDQPQNLEPLCFTCHVREHSLAGEWSDWGRKGGRSTAQNPVNWLHNLHWARDMKRHAPDLWVQHVLYHTGRISEKPMSWAEWKRRNHQ